MFNTTPLPLATLTAGRRGAARQRRFRPARAGGDEGRPGDALRRRRRARPAALKAGRRRRRRGQGRHRAGRRGDLEGKGERAVRFFVSAAETARRATAAAVNVIALDMTEQRTLQENFAQSQKMQAIGQLAGGIAHDFNNVLTAIIGYSDLLLVNHRPTDPSFQDIMQIRQNANRAAGLVRQLLAFSRRQTLRPQVLQLADVLSELQMMLRRLVGEKIELEVEHGRDLWLVKADLNQFEQVIVNLVVNARDAMSEGGRITLRTRNVAAEDCAAFGEKSLPAGEYRAGRSAGHRPRHSRRRARQDLRAVLHHQGGRQGHRPRPVDGLRHRQADRRLRVLRQRARARARRSASCCRATSPSRSSRRRRRPRPSPPPISPAAARSCWSRTRRRCAPSPRAR